MAEKLLIFLSFLWCAGPCLGADEAYDLTTLRTQSAAFRGEHFSGFGDQQVLAKLVNAQNTELGEKAMGALAVILVDSESEAVARRAADALFNTIPYYRNESLRKKNEQLLHWLLAGNAGERPLRRLLTCSTIASDQEMPPSVLSTFSGKSVTDSSGYRRLLASLPSERTSLQARLADSWVTDIWMIERDPTALLARMRGEFQASNGKFTAVIRDTTATLWAFGGKRVHSQVLAEVVRGHALLLAAGERSLFRATEEEKYHHFLEKLVWPRAEVVSLLESQLLVSDRALAASAARLFFNLDKRVAAQKMLAAGFDLPEGLEQKRTLKVFANRAPLKTVGDLMKRVGGELPIRDPQTKLTAARVYRMIETFDLHTVYLERLSALAQSETPLDDMEWFRDIFEMAGLCKWDVPYMFAQNALRPALALGMGHFSSEVRDLTVHEMKKSGVPKIVNWIAFSLPDNELRRRAMVTLQYAGDTDAVLMALWNEIADPESRKGSLALWYADRMERASTVAFLDRILSSPHLTPPGDPELSDDAAELKTALETQGVRVQIGNGIGQIPGFDDRMEAYTSAVHLAVMQSLSQNPNPETLALLMKHAGVSRFPEVRKYAAHAKKFQAANQIRSENPNCPQAVFGAGINISSELIGDDVANSSH